ncbi:MAG: hypothetical protein U9R51_06955 [Actinomycetota bacterium]|nr:hypothetical protein [Actinomycetota bacterium]
MWGTDKADADSKGGHADGEVLFVDPDGPFDEELVGRSTHWSGDFGESQTKFSGPFRIT